MIDLHCHLGTWIDADLGARLLLGQDRDWTVYEEGWRRLYGGPCPLRDLRHRLGLGHDTALADWQQHYRFGDADGPGFERFQVKADLAFLLGPWADPGLSRGHCGPAIAQLEQLLERVANDCRQQGLRAVELRLHLGLGLPRALRLRLWRALLASCTQRSDNTLDLALVADLPRAAPLQLWDDLSELVLGEHGDRLVAIDFAHREEGSEVSDLATVIPPLHAFNASHPQRALAALIHVGESWSDRSHASAIRAVHEAAIAGFQRLGHALAVGLDPELFDAAPRWERVSVRRAQLSWERANAENLRAAGATVDPTAIAAEEKTLAERAGNQQVAVGHTLHELRARQHFVLAELRRLGTVIECCPTANCRIAGIDLSSHPLPRLLDAGLRCVLGSDNPGLLDCTLSGEHNLCRQLVGNAAKQLGIQAERSRSTVLAGRTAG